MRQDIAYSAAMPNGPGAAAILAAGVGSFALAILDLVADQSALFKRLLVFYQANGAALWRYYHRNSHLAVDLGNIGVAVEEKDGGFDAPEFGGIGSAGLECAADLSSDRRSPLTWCRLNQIPQSCCHSRGCGVRGASGRRGRGRCVQGRGRGLLGLQPGRDGRCGLHPAR